MTLESKNFYKSLFHVVGPITIQNLISATVTTADIFMLAFVGQTAIAASSLAGNVMFISLMIGTGLSSGLVMLAAQYWGKKDYNSIRTLHGVTLRISSSFGALFSFATFFFPELVMKIFTDELPMIQEGAKYLKAVSFSYLFFSISQVFQAGFKSIERVKIVTIITTTALSLNILLNAVFIFGLCGFPKWGIFGVGLATSISRGIELVFSVIYAYKQKDVKFRFSNIFRKNRLLTSDFFKYSLPALGNELVWGAGFSMYSVILGHMGEDIVAANSVVNVIRNLATVMCFGMAYGGAVILGKTIGQNDLELAQKNARRLIKSTILSGLLGSVIMIIAKPVLPFIAQNKLTEVAMNYSRVILYINALSIFGASINTVFICGIFRAGGDSKFGFIMDVISMWVVSVPIGLLVAFVFKLHPLWVYFILYLDEFEKMPVVIIHYFKKKWLKNITRE